MFISMVSASCVTIGNNGGIKGNRDVITQERTAVSFNGVVLDGAAKINIHFSDVYKVAVVTDSNLQKLVTIKVRNNLLHIDTRNNLNPTKLEIDVYMPEIKTVNLDGVGDIIFDSGNGTGVEVIFSGVGNVDMQNYHVEEANISGRGVGDITIWADKINGKMTGVGHLIYKGNPVIDFDAKLVGGIERL
jgi:hypothetical protein